MRIISLEPFITDILHQLNRPLELVGVTDRCALPEQGQAPSVIARGRAPTPGSRPLLESRLSSGAVSLEALKAADPEVVLVSLPETAQAMRDPRSAAAAESLRSELSAELERFLGHPVRLSSFNPVTLEQVFACTEAIAKEVGLRERGHELAQRAKAQCMDWSSNFYDRMRNKRVTVLVGAEPLTLGGLWIPDMVHLASCTSQEPVAGNPHRTIRWSDVLTFKPDVLLVAPGGLSKDESFSSFKVIERLPDFESAPAVKRGEVFFTSGDEYLLRPGPKLMDGMGILISAIAGIDSGYITKRDSFHRLRWLEMQRHKF